MAVAAVRNAVGARWRVVSNAVASTDSAVRCAVEPGRRQLVGLAVSRSSRVRCPAAMLAGVRELAESREVEVPRGSFEAASVSERTGAEDEARELSRMHYGRRGGGDAYLGNDAEEEEAGVMGKSGTPPHEMVAAFEAALLGAGRNAEALCDMAMRAWRKLGDADRAEQLYLEALRIAPDDNAVQASYAQFLWQCDA